jgi:hypothetical protein
VSLIWKGDAIVARIERAAEAATIETVDEAISVAAPNTPVLTGATRNSLRREGDGLSQRWGYHTSYGIFVEIGSRGRAGAHALRRAADRAYGHLVRRIREHMA